MSFFLGQISQKIFRISATFLGGGSLQGKLLQVNLGVCGLGPPETLEVLRLHFRLF